MKICTDPMIRIQTEAYSVSFHHRRLLATYQTNDDNFYYGMCMLSAVDKPGKQDITCEALLPEITTRDRRGCEVVVEERSSLWERKRHHYRCSEDRLEYWLELDGKGKIDRCYFFRGALGERELGSLPGFSVVVPGQANFLNKTYFHASDCVRIGLALDTCVWGPALTSGPLCFLLNNNLNSQWVSVGLAPKPGQYGFHSFDFGHKPQSVVETHDSVINTQSLSIDYCGKESVDGHWESPRLIVRNHNQANLYEAIRQYAEQLRRDGCAPRLPQKTHAWWSTPIFCGWHEQVARGVAAVRDASKLELESGERAKAECTQENYENWLRIFDNRDIEIGTFIIDANWQVCDGTWAVDTSKWTDLRGFIDGCHNRGLHVVLWFGAWFHKGVPANECITLDGEPVACDPTNPRYLRRLADDLRRMLSDEPGCYNADGLKIDHTNTQPAGIELRNHGNVWGHELLKNYLQFIYSTTKSIKRDAMVGLFTANPYFADVVDVIRLGDHYTTEGDARGTMLHRANIIRAAMPGKPIDTDGTIRFDMRESFMSVLEDQRRVGIPTLYQIQKLTRRRAFALPVGGEFGEDDYACIKETFGRFSKESETFGYREGKKS